MNRARIACGFAVMFAIVLQTRFVEAVPRQESRPAVQYTVTDIGTLPDCDVTYAVAVNDSGVVAGYAHRGSGHGVSALSKPFVWQNGTLVELPTLGGEYGQALAVNTAGDVGGYATKPGYKHAPVVWRKSTGYRPEALSEQAGRVLSLLDSGNAVGHRNDNGRMTAVVWQNGRAEVIGNVGDAENVATGASRNGIVVGYYVPEGGSRESVMNEGNRRAVMWKGGKQITLPGLDDPEPAVPDFHGNRRSACNAINALGVAVGFTDAQSGRTACSWKNGKVEALPVFEGFRTEAHSINKGGVIVGEALENANKEGWKWLACTWRDGKIEDLNKLIPPNSGWKLHVAKQISDTGFIVGYGTYDRYPKDRWRAFMLKPVSK